MLSLDLIRNSIGSLCLGTRSAVIEVGSCSRGEESYFINTDGVRELLSDYEILVVVGEDESIDSLNTQLSTIKTTLEESSGSPFFSLDYSFIPRWKLRFLDKRFIHFETKEAASIIAGDTSVINEFPKITTRNLNYAELSSVVNHRLYHVLRDYESVGDYVKKYLLARNSLDIATVVLPYYGKLICGYGRRNEAMRSIDLSRWFTPDLCNRLDIFLEMKLSYMCDIYSTISLRDMLVNFENDMKSLHRFLADQNNGHCFINSGRRCLSALVRLSPTRLGDALRFPHEEEALYDTMMSLLENRDFSVSSVSPISGTMKAIYGYR